METWQMAGLIAAGMLSLVAAVRLVAGAVRRALTARRRARPRVRVAQAEYRGPIPQAAEAPPAAEQEPTTEIDQRLAVRVRQLEELLAAADEKIRQLSELRKAPATPPPQPQPPQQRPAAEPRQLAVVRLSQQGLDAVEIARKLNIDVGEVELILNLRRPGARGLSGRPAAP